MRPSTDWFVGMSETDKKSFEEYLRNNHRILSRILDIAQKWEDELTRSECKDDYSEGWAYKQASRNGDRARIRKLIDLVSFIKG